MDKNIWSLVLEHVDDYEFPWILTVSKMFKDAINEVCKRRCLKFGYIKYNNETYYETYINHSFCGSCRYYHEYFNFTKKNTIKTKKNAMKRLQIKTCAYCTKSIHNDDKWCTALSAGQCWRCNKIVCEGCLMTCNCDNTQNYKKPKDICKQCYVACDYCKSHVSCCACKRRKKCRYCHLNICWHCANTEQFVKKGVGICKCCK